MNWHHEQEIVDWFLDAYNKKLLPIPPFQLAPWMQVINIIFYERLKEAIADGPKGPRGAVLPDDLRLLKCYMEKLNEI